MSGENDSCGSDDSSLSDDVAPMRKWEGPAGTGSYTEGPTHLDRVDYGEGDAKDDAKDETGADAKAENPDQAKGEIEVA